MINRLAWVTSGSARGRDEDEPSALAALRSAGLRVDVVNWDDASVQWSGYDRAVLRSTWDYSQRVDDFRGWLSVVDAATDLRNPAAMVRWGMDKRYLADLAGQGVPVTPTVFADAGQTPPFPAGAFVVKPAVGAGSRDVAAYRPDQHDLARAHVARLHQAGRCVLVQPLLASVAVDGEWPLVFFGGQYSHAASRRVALPRAEAGTGPSAPETRAPHQADPDQLRVARAAIDTVAARFGVPTYARVDLVRDPAGQPCVLEVELAEPCLFLPHASSDALTRLVDAFARP